MERMSSVFRLSHASLVRDDLPVLTDVSWDVDSSQRWVILGPNGAGKTSLLELIAAWELPTTGSAIVLGDDLSTADTDWLRPRVGLASSGMAKRIPASETVEQAVITAAIAAAEARPSPRAVRGPIRPASPKAATSAEARQRAGSQRTIRRRVAAWT